MLVYAPDRTDRRIRGLTQAWEWIIADLFPRTRWAL
jgi:hypothetical protein